MNTPDYITEFLKQDMNIFDKYKNLPLSHQREYIQWIEEAKQEKTKIRRMEKMIIMLVDSE